MFGLRVAVVATDFNTTGVLEEILCRLGCVVESRIFEEPNALEVIKMTKPDLVVVEGSTNFLDLAKTIRKNNIAPIILFSDKEIPYDIAQIKGKWGYSFLDQPGDAAKWKTAIKVSMDKFMNREEITLGRKLINSAETTRTIVDQAKQMLMANWKIGESQALYTIQILAHNQGITIRQMAEKIISVHRFTEETA